MGFTLTPWLLSALYSEHEHDHRILKFHRELAIKAKCLSHSLPYSHSPSFPHNPSEAEYCFSAQGAWMRSDMNHLKAMAVTHTLWKMLLWYSRKNKRVCFKPSEKKREGERKRTSAGTWILQTDIGDGLDV